MKSFFNKYSFFFITLLLLIVTATFFNPLLNKYKFILTASVFNPSNIPNASIASGFAWNDSIGWINFGTSTERNTARVYVDDANLHGYAWGENIGWISLNCLNDGSCGTLDYGVEQDGDGNLTGKAWGENIGWIDFAPDGGGVTIDPITGEFSGYAWGENIGWISFSSESPAYGVTTDWRNYPPITIELSTSTISLYTSATTSLSATVSGTTTTDVTWSADSGNFSDANATSTVYTAGTTAGTYYIVATAVASSSITATTTVTILSRGGGSSNNVTTCNYEYSVWSACVNSLQTRTVTPDPAGCSNQAEELSQSCVATTTPPVPISISLSPASTSLYTGESFQFTAKVTGSTTDNSADWLLLPVENIIPNFYGTLSNTGLYIAPERAVNVTVQARANADITKIATANVTVRLWPATSTPPINIFLSPASSTILAGEKLQFTANVTGTTTNQEVEWDILPIEDIVKNFYGKIDKNGLYTAPERAVNITVRARAKADPTKVAMAKVTVRLTIPEPIIATSTDELKDDDEKDNDNTDPNTVTKQNNNRGGGGHGGNKEDDSIISNLNVSNLLINNVAVLGTTTEKIVLGAKKIIESKAGSAVTNTITTAGVVGGGVAASSVLIFNGATATDLLFLPFKLWGLLLSALGLKKRNRPWGTVYDSVTKQPIDPAYVTLKKINSKDEDTCITDLDGRYGFLVHKGKYILSANKTNYIFPSKKLLGKTSDTLYDNLYFGEEININMAGAIINKNIPLDPLKFDWNEFVKGKKKIMRFYSRREKLIRIITDWIFRIGFIISIISLFLVSAPYNYVIFALYIILSLLRKFGLKQKAHGALIDKNGDPLSFAVIRVFSSEFNMEITRKVADKIGHYYCLVNKGKYYVKIEKKNDDESYTEVYTSPAFDADNGIINKNFTV